MTQRICRCGSFSGTPPPTHTKDSKIPPKQRQVTPPPSDWQLDFDEAPWRGRRTAFWVGSNKRFWEALHARGIFVGTGGRSLSCWAFGSMLVPPQNFTNRWPSFCHLSRFLVCCFQFTETYLHRRFSHLLTFPFLSVCTHGILLLCPKPRYVTPLNESMQRALLGVSPHASEYVYQTAHAGVGRLLLPTSWAVGSCASTAKVKTSNLLKSATC